MKQTVILALIKKYGTSCQYCGKELNENNFVREHMTPQSQGGTNSLDNLTIACLSCNSQKGNKTVAEYRAHKYLKTQSLVGELYSQMCDWNMFSPVSEEKKAERWKAIESALYFLSDAAETIGVNFPLDKHFPKKQEEPQPVGDDEKTYH